MLSFPLKESAQTTFLAIKPVSPEGGGVIITQLLNSVSPSDKLETPYAQLLALHSNGRLWSVNTGIDYGPLNVHQLGDNILFPGTIIFISSIN